ncbi:MAG: capsule biosynthesis protein [Pseudomonadota bacterium]
MQKNGLEARSDLDAVRLLRKSGIEPFATPNIGAGAAAPSAGGDTSAVKVPMKGPGQKSNQLTSVSPEERELSIRKIQQNLVRRRRRRIFATLAKLFVFIALPTIVAGYYFSQLATPIYSSHSSFVVQKNSGASTAAGGLLGGTSFATAQESISVQQYLEGRPVMLRLDEEYGFRRLFEGEDIDAIQRLTPDATNESAHSLYNRRVKISYDPTEGIIGLEVSTPDPVASYEISNILHRYAEAEVGQMTARSEADQIRGARDALAEAEQNLEAAQSQVLELQSSVGILNSQSEISFLMSEITTMETQRRELELDQEELLSNARPNQARVDALQRQIDRLDERIRERRSRMTEGGEDTMSLARIQSELNAAEIELAMRQSILSSSIQNFEVARQEASRQSIYLNRAVEPTIADDNTYPKVFENTLLSFLVFAGIYLMVTLTYSILREQMTT